MRCVLIALVAARLAGGEAATADLTTDETAILLLLNSHRTDRRVVDNRINQLITAGAVDGSPSRWAHRGSTAEQPALAVNPALVKVARDLLKAGTRPKANEFLNPKAAMAAAGYGAVDGFAIFAFDRPDQLNAYATAMLSVTDAKHDKQQTAQVYAAQFALKPDWREVGVATAVGKGGMQLVLVLGPGTAKRHLGGMVYADANRNRMCDAGEGVAGVTATCGDRSMTTGPSGAWWLAVDSAAAGTVTFAGGGFTTTRDLAKGVDNPGFSWRMPSATDITAADALIAAAEKAAGDPAARRAPLATLLCATRMASLDEARERRIAGLVEPLLPEYDAALNSVFSTFTMEAAASRLVLSNLQKAWKPVAPAWYAEAEGLSRLGQQVIKVRAAAAADGGKASATLVKQLQKLKTASLEPRFLQQYLIWEDQLSEPVPAEDPAPKKDTPKKK